MQTANQPRTRRSAPTTQRPSALHSQAAAQLIKQIQAEARAILLEELSAKDGITVLQPLDTATRRVCHKGNRIVITDRCGADFSAHRDHNRSGSTYTGWHPAYWLASCTLLDGVGKRWTSFTGPLVCDDFGNLVEVAL